MGKKLTNKDMDNLAFEKGGVFLSEEYVNIHTEYEWECIRGHRFFKKASYVKKGSWCPECNPHYNEVKCKYILEQLTGKKLHKTRKILDSGLELDGYNEELRFAFEYNGVQHYQKVDFYYKSTEEFQQRLKNDRDKFEECYRKGIDLIIIPYYVGDDKRKVRYLKDKLRTFNIPFDDIDVDFKDFYLKHPSLERAKLLAKENKGKCLSNEYETSKHPLKWECKKGHIWEAPLSTIQQKSWCPTCAIESISKSQRFDLNEIHKIAQKNNGKCLSDLETEYKNQHSTLKWECSHGHIWETPFKYVRRGSWCRTCKPSKKQPQFIEEAHRLAKQNNGVCLSEKYINFRTPLLWKTSDGHIFKASLHKVRNGYWYQEKFKDGYSIEFMHELSKKRNGSCLSDTYINSYTPLLWKCSEGHVWEETPEVIMSGVWCPKCKKNKKKTIEGMQLAAEKRNGVCLSDTYTNSHTKLLWQCQNGHTFEATPSKVLNQNQWCKTCANTKLKKTIEDMKALAKEKNGDCLSSTYVNYKTKLTWQCEHGHTWDARPTNIQQGQWCPTCNRNSKRNVLETYMPQATI